MHTPSAARRALFGPVLIAALLAAVPARAEPQPPGSAPAVSAADPERVALARRLLAAESADLFERMIAAERTAFRESWGAANPGREAEVDRLFAEVALPLLLAKRETLLDAQAAFTATRMSPEHLAQALEMSDSPAMAALRRLNRDERFQAEMEEAMSDRIGLFEGIGLARRGARLEDLMRQAGLSGREE